MGAIRSVPSAPASNRALLTHQMHPVSTFHAKHMSNMLPLSHATPRGNTGAQMTSKRNTCAIQSAPDAAPSQLISGMHEACKIDVPSLIHHHHIPLTISGARTATSCPNRAPSTNVSSGAVPGLLCDCSEARTPLFDSVMLTNEIEACLSQLGALVRRLEANIATDVANRPRRAISYPTNALERHTHLAALGLQVSGVGSTSNMCPAKPRDPRASNWSARRAPSHAAATLDAPKTCPAAHQPFATHRMCPNGKPMPNSRRDISDTHTDIAQVRYNDYTRCSSSNATVSNQYTPVRHSTPFPNFAPQSRGLGGSIQGAGRPLCLRRHTSPAHWQNCERFRFSHPCTEYSQLHHVTGAPGVLRNGIPVIGVHYEHYITPARHQVFPTAHSTMNRNHIAIPLYSQVADVPTGTQRRQTTPFTPSTLYRLDPMTGQPVHLLRKSNGDTSVTWPQRIQSSDSDGVYPNFWDSDSTLNQYVDPPAEDDDQSTVLSTRSEIPNPLNSDSSESDLYEFYTSDGSSSPDEFVHDDHSGDQLSDDLDSASSADYDSYTASSAADAGTQESFGSLSDPGFGLDETGSS